VAASLNLVAALAAWGVGRAVGVPAPLPEERREGPGGGTARSAPGDPAFLWRLLLGVSFGTALATLPLCVESFGWTAGLLRLLSPDPEGGLELPGIREGLRGGLLYTPLPQVPAARALALSNRIRRAREGRETGEGGEGDPELRAALGRVGELERVLRGTNPPTDWLVWTQDVLGVLGMLEEGGNGMPEEALREELAGFLRRAGAPQPVRESLELVRGLLERDWSTVARTTGSLARELAEGRTWVAPAVLLDAGVAARLLLGRGEEARAFYASVRPRVTRSGEDLRSRLLRAHLDLRHPLP